MPLMHLHHSPAALAGHLGRKWRACQAFGIPGRRTVAAVFCCGGHGQTSGHCAEVELERLKLLRGCWEPSSSCRQQQWPVGQGNTADGEQHPGQNSLVELHTSHVVCIIHCQLKATDDLVDALRLPTTEVHYLADCLELGFLLQWGKPALQLSDQLLNACPELHWDAGLIKLHLSCEGIRDKKTLLRIVTGICRPTSFAAPVSLRASAAPCLATSRSVAACHRSRSETQFLKL